MPSAKTLTLRIAEVEDTEMVVSIVREASDWLAERGILWLRQFPGGTPQRVAEGNVWLASLDDGSEPVATVALVPMPDPELWEAHESDALFVHGLAVRRSLSGWGIGSALLDFACDRAARQDIPWVRLDCNKTNLALQAYYRRHGFTYLRTIDLPHRNTGALFQKRAQRSAAVRPADSSPGRFTVDLESASTT